MAKSRKKGKTAKIRKSKGKSPKPAKPKAVKKAAVHKASKKKKPSDSTTKAPVPESPPSQDIKRTESAAVAMAARQRDISVSEFFSKNRHLLGFDNSKKALLTVIKEGVDNSLDACEEAGIMPEIIVEVKELSNDRFVVAIEDNGPGIVRSQISRIFAKLLYGSKFHTLKMSRGQQGIGISAAVMYGQITTGQSTHIFSKTAPKKPAHNLELHINLQRNQPEILKDEEIEWDKSHGTRVVIELEAKYQKGKQSVDEYLRLTAVANPHLRLVYRLILKKSSVAQQEQEQAESTEAKEENVEEIVYERAVKNLPRHPKAIKPHPYGVELGILMRMLKQSKSRSVKSFLSTEFSRVSSRTAEDICKAAGVSPKMRPITAGRTQSEAIYNAIQQVKIMNPSTDCIAPIGEENIIAGLKREADCPFYAAVTRPPSVYRGNPFQIEVGVAYGGGNLPGDDLIQVMRFANRVPLLYQQSACVSFKTVVQTAWRNYGLQQSKGALPTGPMILFVHMASVWVPFTSESKEAVAHYPEIAKQMRLAFQDVGRKLGIHIRQRRRAADELKKRQYIEKYIPQIGIALQEILGLSDKQVKQTTNKLKTILERTRKM